MREGTTGKTHTIGGDLKQLKNQELCLQPTEATDERTVRK
jgi:hypothetical protein